MLRKGLKWNRFSRNQLHYQFVRTTFLGAPNNNTPNVFVGQRASNFMIRFSGIAPVAKKIHLLSYLCLIFPACWVTNFRCLPVSNPTLQKVSTLNSNAQTHKHTRKQIGWMDSCAKTTSNKNETNLIRQANISQLSSFLLMVKK